LWWETANGSNKEKAATEGEHAQKKNADMLTFRLFCLINLFVVSYSIFILFCVHVTVERNNGGQGVLHSKCQKAAQVQAFWMDMNEGKHTGPQTEQPLEEPTEGHCGADWKPRHLLFVGNPGTGTCTLGSK